MFRHIFHESLMTRSLLGEGVKESILFVLLSMLVTPHNAWIVLQCHFLKDFHFDGNCLWPELREHLLWPGSLWLVWAGMWLCDAGDVFSGDAVTTTLLASHHLAPRVWHQAVCWLHQASETREWAGSDWSGLRLVSRVWLISGNLLLSEIVNHQTAACLGAVFRWMNVQYLN